MTALLLLSALPALADTSCLARAAARIDSVRPLFRSLDGLNLVLEPYEAKDEFYRAEPRSSWRAPRDRTYAVLVNTAACADPPPEDAERAILAHELAHLESYSRLTTRELVSLGWQYLAHPEGKEVEAFEKSADDAVVRAGLAEGLARYREWMYPRVSAKALTAKKKLYRTPEELRALTKDAPKGNMSR